MKCTFSKVDCNDCKVKETCEVYDTLMGVPVLWGEDAEEFEKEMKRKPTAKELATIRRAQKAFKTIKEAKE